MNLIIIDQEYSNANHKFFWKEFASTDGDITVIVNISADLAVSVLKRKFYRIQDAKAGAIRLADNLYLMRPLFLVRHEALPLKILFAPFIRKYYQRLFWMQLSAVVPDVMARPVFLLSYSSSWLDLLAGSHPNMKSAYYLYDEFRNNPDGTQHPKRTAMDEVACKEADVILAMTPKLINGREMYSEKFHVFGNGASLSLFSHVKATEHIDNSVGLIGNIRNWIDKELLESLVRRNPDLQFVFAGNVEEEMKPFVDSLLAFKNTRYIGKFSKEDVPAIYKMVDCVIVPYLQNAFIQATRPIKIVESVFAGTPVVSIPISGYSETEFIRFAKTDSSFADQIRYVISHPISKESADYKGFVQENSWEGKALKLKTIKSSLFDDTSGN